MPSTLIFGCLELKGRSFEIPFPKSLVYSDEMLGKLGESFESFFSNEKQKMKL